MFNNSARSSRYRVVRASIIALATSLAASQPATADVQVPVPIDTNPLISSTVPLSDTNCDLGSSFTLRVPPCTVDGTRSTTLVDTVRSSFNATMDRIESTYDVSFDGQLQVDGLPFSNSSGPVPLPPFTNASFYYDNASQTVDLAATYTGTASSIVMKAAPTPDQNFEPAKLFNTGNYDLDVRSIEVAQSGTAFTSDNGEYDFSFGTTDPTAIVNGNSVAVSGRYSGTSGNGAIQFGTLNGTATLQTGNVVAPYPEFSAPGQAGFSIVSNFGLAYETQAQLTTQLDENGLLTPKVEVSQGIEMNGSKITGLGDGTDPGDAVNKGQLDAAIAGIATVGSDGSFSSGTGSSANGEGAVAIGQGQSATGNGAVAIGDPNVATGTGAVSIGADNTAIGDGAVALGNANTATGLGNVAIGNASTASAPASIAIGLGANTTSANAASLGSSIALGNLALASDEDAVAICDQANAAGFHSTAVGGEAVASGRGAQAFGWQAQAIGNLGFAAGHQANAGGVQATALGKSANAAGANATAIGFGASAAFDGSTAVGTGASATRVNQVVLGGAGSSVTIGDLAASTAAQAGPAFVATTDAGGTLGQGPAVSSLATVAALDTERQQRIAADAALGAQIGGFGAQINTLTGQVDTLFGRTEENRRLARKANEGVAVALAMDTPTLLPDENFAVTGGVGYWSNRTGGSMAATARVSDNVSFSAGLGVGFDSGEDGARGGFRVGW